MLGLPKKLLYAIEAVLDIAYNAGGDPVQSMEISRRQGIPRRYLEPALQRLVRAGVLAGVRGPRGGYRLARERRRITLGEITRVLGAIEAASDPLAPESGSDLGQRVLQPIWRQLQAESMARLDEISIEDLCLKARGQGVTSDAFSKLDYNI